MEFIQDNWLPILALLGASVAVGPLATYRTVAWLRSRRKRPEPRPQEPLMGTLLPPMERPPFSLPEGIEEEAALAEVNYKRGYAAGWNAAWSEMRLPSPMRLPPPAIASPPSSPPSPGQPGKPSGS